MDQNDLSGQYMAKAEDSAKSNDAAEMERWIQSYDPAKPPEKSGPMELEPAPTDMPAARMVPKPPLRRKTDDSLGRPTITDETKGFAGRVMRNVAEIPRSVVGGVDDAARNALSIFNPLTDWLNENVADLRYDPVRESKTTTGVLTRKISQFMTGFLPILKGLRAAGVANKIAGPVLAGALGDFATRSPQEGRLADLWQSAGLPKNVLTDYLASDPKDSAIEGRFKNAVEMGGFGLATEGLMLGVRALRAMHASPDAAKSEIEFLKGRYGTTDVSGAPGVESDFVPFVPPTLDVDLSRRGFLKTAGAGAVNAALGSPAMKAAAAILPEAGAGVAGVAKAAAEAVAPKIIKALIPMESLFKHTKGGTLINPKVLADHPEIGKALSEIGIDPLKLEGTFEELMSVGGSMGEVTGTVVKALESKGIRLISNDVETGMSQIMEEILGATNYHPKMIKVLSKYETLGEGGAGDLVYLEHLTPKEFKSMMKEFASTAEELGVKVHGITPSGTITGIARGRYPKELTLGKGLEHDPGAEERFMQQVGEYSDEAVAAEKASAARTEAQISTNVAAKIGDAKAPLIESKPTPPATDAAKKLVKGGAETATTDPRALIRAQKGAGVPEFDTYINFGRINEPDQVKFVIGKMAEKLKGTVDEARRGVITQEETQALADDLGMSVAGLLSRKVGGVFNAEEAVAARRIWAASGEKLLELAKVANSKNAGPLDHFAFRKMMATHAAIQAEVIGARTESARSLASWAIPVEGGIEQARAIEQVMGAMGGTTTTKELARRLAILGEQGADAATIGKYAQAGWGATTMDAIKEVWVNGLLSSPKTHAVNITSNTLVAFQQIYERAAASGIRAFTGGEGVVGGEAASMAYGMVESTKDAFRMAAKALKTGETGWSLNKMDLPRTNAISPEAFRMSRETGMGRFVDFLGTATNVPGRLLGAEDEFFKTIGYRMELHAQALRTASQEGLKGAGLSARVADILKNPPEFIKINAADAALYSTFTNEVGNFGRAVMNLRDRVPAVTFVLPFVRTPVNIARYTFERTPLAPLVGQWRADIAAGGARADLALARMATGTAIVLAAMDIADSGMISGEGPKNADKDVREAMMRQGWGPYSIKIPGTDRWTSYNRLDPLGMTIGMAASIAESIKHGEVQQDDVDEWHEVTAMLVAAASQATISKTYLQGAANFVAFMTDPRRNTQKYVDDMIASFLPGTALMQAVKNVGDPVQREVNNPWEAVKARVLGLSDTLTPRRNLWGEQITIESGLGKGYDFLSPASSKPEVLSPIDREMVRMNDGPLRITKRAPFDGVMANMRPYPQVYDEYTRLAGNGLKHPAWGMGAKDYLDAVVGGKHPMSAVYNVMSDESRKAFISSTIQDYRKLSQRQIMADPRFKNFTAEIQRLKEIHQGARMPVLGE